MRISNLYRPELNVYSSNVYLIRGDHNALNDVNTLIDVGNDETMISRLQKINTGVGKKRVDQIILTHSHFDHARCLSDIKEKYQLRVYAYTQNLDNVDQYLKDGQLLRVADKYFRVIHAPFHTQDSICLYCKSDGVLFVGDTPIIIYDDSGSYSYKYLHFLQKLARLNIKVIFFGHGEPIWSKGKQRILYSIKMVKSALNKKRTNLH